MLSGHRVGHIEALYFTVTTFTSLGPSDLSPHLGLCKMTVALQTIVGLVVVSLIVATLGARLVRLAEREDADSSSQ
jgi:hypothetical protein